MNTGGSATTAQNSGGNAITLNQGNLLRGLTVSGASGAGLIGASISTLTVGADVSLSAVTGNDLDLSGAANGTVNFAASITNTAGRSVSIQNRSGGAVNLTGAISDTGTGILLNSNTGATITFSGGLSLSAGANAAFTATGGGTVSATQNNTTIINTLTTTTATALNAQNTNSGASDMIFRSINSPTSSGNSGVVLISTGTAGGLTVTGTGGTISNKTAAAIQSGSPISPNGTTAGCGLYLSNTAQVSLTSMNLSTFTNHAIFANSVTDFTLASSNVSGVNGNQEGFDEGSIFIYEGAGTYNFTSSDSSGGLEDNVKVVYQSATARTAVWNFTNFRTGQRRQRAGQSVFRQHRVHFVECNFQFYGLRFREHR